MSQSIYQQVTEQIIEHLEQGVAPWVKPWSGDDDTVPRNAVSRRAYRGINTLVLSMCAFAKRYPSNQWVTFKQALSLGGTVRKGERSTTIVYFDTYNAEDDGHTVRKAFVKTFNVFNVCQCDGLDSLIETPSDEIVWEPHAFAQKLIDRSGADITIQGSQAYYAPAEDRIVLPDWRFFTTVQDYYTTALHELSHWTGHPTRLNRNLRSRFGSNDYAMEELIAEIGSAFLCAHCRIDGTLHHASYINDWLKVLKQDPRSIFTAAAQAQRVSDFLLEHTDFASEYVLPQAA